jgi:DNA replication protein DnaC
MAKIMEDPYSPENIASQIAKMSAALDGLQESGAPLLHRKRSGIVFDGPWGENFNRLKSQLGNNLFACLVGKGGPGKTQMAVELMKASAAMNRRPLYTTAFNLFVRIKTTYRAKPGMDVDTESHILNSMRWPKFLVLDELGKRADTQWEGDFLCAIINTRYQDMKDTLLISNQDVGTLESSLGSSIMDRLNECGGVIDCNWPSFRTK